jgi:hypothetical protein
LVKSQEAQGVARQALKILGVKEIPKNEDYVKVLASLKFLMMSSIEVDIMETSRTIVRLLKQGKIEQASSYLKKLEELVSALPFE